MLDSDFAQIAAILIIAAVAGGIGTVLRQPLIVVYIVVGIIVGPSALGLVTATDQIALLAQIGIAILLFLVGLKLDIHLIRSTGPVALITGLGQVIFTLTVGFGLALLLGFDGVSALYVGVAVAFSSTIIVIKLLSDKRQLDDLHSRIAIGVLIVQDLLVILAMIIIVSLGPGSLGSVSEHGFAADIAVTAVGGVGFLLVVLLLARYVLPTLLDFIARNQELTLLFVVAWAAVLAAVGYWLGLSMEVGAFLAGVSLASTPYRESLGARLISLRDILILFFFIELGSTIILPAALTQLLPAIVLAAFVLIGKPLIVMSIMGMMGYRKRVSFLSGLALAQISEFSLILIALGYSLGQVNDEVVGLVTMVFVITVALSTYLTLHADSLYERLAPALSIFEREHPKHGEGDTDDGVSGPIDAIVVGAGRFGSALIEALRAQRAQLLVVDFDPHVLRHWRDEGVNTLYGDIGEPDFVMALPVHEANSVVCTVPNLSVNLVLFEAVQRMRFQGLIALTALDERSALTLSSAAGERVTVLRPFLHAADAAAQVVLLHRDGEQDR